MCSLAFISLMSCYASQNKIEKICYIFFRSVLSPSVRVSFDFGVLDHDLAVYDDFTG